MDWIDEMKEAIETLKTACDKNEMNEIWGACVECPFDKYCTVLENEGMGIPSEWEID